MLKAGEVRLVTLSENASTGDDFLGEWGLCVLIEAGDRRVLLDAGAGPSTVHNADHLDVDLREIETIVISHGHADHTGGLRAVLRRRHGRKTRIVAHPDVWAEKYSRHAGESAFRFSGIPFRKAALESLG